MKAQKAYSEYEINSIRELLDKKDSNLVAVPIVNKYVQIKRKTVLAGTRQS